MLKLHQICLSDFTTAFIPPVIFSFMNDAAWLIKMSGKEYKRLKKTWSRRTNWLSHFSVCKPQFGQKRKYLPFQKEARLIKVSYTMKWYAITNTNQSGKTFPSYHKYKALLCFPYYFIAEFKLKIQMQIIEFIFFQNTDFQKGSLKVKFYLVTSFYSKLKRQSSGQGKQDVNTTLTFPVDSFH